MKILVSVLIGAIAGWLAVKMMKSKSGGVLVNILLGIIGGFVGNWLFDILNLSTNGGWLGSIITSTFGAISLIALLRYLRKK